MAETKKTEAAPEAGEMISAKEAVLIASKYYMEVTGNTKGVSVEEIELTEDGKCWLVTLGVPSQKVVAYFGIETLDYKIFKVNARTGQVLSMKLRSVK